MHQDLVLGFEKMIETIKLDERCKGAWYYGSVGRGDFDQFSDFDPVFLVSEKDFEDFANDVKFFVSKSCDELLISWAEDYNSQYFKNFCNLIRINNNLHQLDFFILNADRTENWWCRQHLKGCTRNNIIFDSKGEVGALLDKGLRTENNIPDPQRCFDTYWFHVEMLIKYFKRKDIFKIIKNMDFLFHSHVDLLLSEYDELDWGAWETKVKKCVPEEKQAHLLPYYTTPGFDTYSSTIKQCIKTFDKDAKEIFDKKNLSYPENVSNQVINYFNRMVE
ncbi:MAG: aminoglycoside 6-adenylyltransferase [Spirochaetales bacterium]|nr:aminoglycoside 6-adenylyltransferase [Spirochaetales bacterium]